MHFSKFSYTKKGFASLGFLLLGIQLLMSIFAYFYAAHTVPKEGARKLLPIGSALTIIYVAAYIIPVSCAEQNSTAGLCAKGFATPLLVLTAIISGFGLGVFFAKT